MPYVYSVISEYEETQEAVRRITVINGRWVKNT